ncbi:MAG: hypothetical protein ABI577_12490 [bacterium]
MGAGATGAAAGPAPRPVVRRGVVIVHGIGDQGRGDYIGSFVEPLASFVADGAGSENVSITVRNEADASAWATLHIKGDARDEEWHIREAWWAKNFHPSASKTVLFWAIIAGLTILWATWRSVFVRAVARLRHDYQQMKLSRDDLYGRPLDPETFRLKVDSAQGLWVVPQTLRAKAILDGVIWLFICAIYLAVALVLITFLVPLYLFLLLPLSFVLPTQIVAVQRKVANLLVSTIGDQQAMTTRRFALAGASNEVSQALWWMLCKDGLDRSRRTIDGFTGYETVTVVAHSGGCIVSFDALAGEVAGWMADPELPKDVRRPSRVNWITAGSGLNLAFRMRRTKDPREHAFWHRRIGQFVNWVNIYARYDPVPQGPPPAELVETFLSPDPWLADPPDTSGERSPFVCLRVVNTDFPASDHTSYWQNPVEVMSRVAAVISDSARANRTISPQDDAYPETMSSGLTAAIKATANPDACRRSRSAAIKRQVPMYIGILVVVGLLALGSLLGHFFLKSNVVDHLAPHSILGADISSQRQWIAGVAVGSLLALIVAQLISFVGQLVGWARAGGSAAVVPVGGIMVAAGVGVGVALVVLLSSLWAVK